MSLILASGSRYRQEQLRGLGLTFASSPADIDESRQPEEVPLRLAQRLAKTKARTVFTKHPQSVVIGADQVCAQENNVLGKPGEASRACEQLERLSGRVVTFHSAVTVVGPDAEYSFSVPTEVAFRTLTRNEIERYVELDEPFDCAGAVKSEKAGSLLFEYVKSNDPSALIGLPLIELSNILRQFGINPLSSNAPKGD